MWAKTRKEVWAKIRKEVWAKIRKEVWTAKLSFDTYLLIKQGLICYPLALSPVTHSSEEREDNDHPRINK